MLNSVLVTYATRYGSTREVAEAIATTLRENGITVEIKPIRGVRTLIGYDGIILGAPLFMFHLHKDVQKFLSRNRKVLTKKKIAIFALGPVHDPHDKQEWEDSHIQLNNELTKFTWLNPTDVKIFGGQYEPAKLSFPIKLFVGKDPATDIRDWEQIHYWAVNLIEKLKSTLS